MDEKKTQKFRQRLLEEYQKLIRSINRNRLAEEEIKLENTEDEGDLATISHNKELLYNLHESDFQRLKSIQEALKRMDRGEYGECVRCGEDINEKRLMAVPWATLCIQCQEEAEREGTSQRPVMAGMLKTGEEEETPAERLSATQKAQKGTSPFVLFCGLSAMPDGHDIAILHDVFFSFEPQQTFFLQCLQGAVFHEIVVVTHFRSNEMVGQIGVDHSRGVL